ncbi:MAG TPA: type II toxin-antitoxin system VapC family toxin [Stellaceae bacterium]|nr:type II toxin-antitoxin system VapC family toxin [Stellaceae bacterium]
MIRYILDTNAVISLLNDPHSALARRARREPPGDIAISAIVVHELYFGAFRSARADRNVRLIDELQLAVIEFDRDDARQAGAVRAALAAAGTPIGPYDTLIAGQAVSRGLTLVTGNTKEFGRIEGLMAEDWQV